MKLPDYDTWSRDKLVARLIELEERFELSTWDELISKLPVTVTMQQSRILAILCREWPKFVKSSALMVELNMNDTTLRTQVHFLRSTLGRLPVAVSITGLYGQGYRICDVPALERNAIAPGAKKPSRYRRANGPRGGVDRLALQVGEPRDKANAKV